MAKRKEDQVDEEKKVVLPKMLPKEPKGWTRSMTMHLNFGGAVGMGSYEVKDSNGQVMPIGYQYDTRKGGESGFTLPDAPHCMTWEQLRQIWPTFYKKQRESEPGKPEIVAPTARKESSQ